MQLLDSIGGSDAPGADASAAADAADERSLPQPLMMSSQLSRAISQRRKRDRMRSKKMEQRSKRRSLEMLLDRWFLPCSCMCLLLPISSSLHAAFRYHLVCAKWYGRHSDSGACLGTMDSLSTPEEHENACGSPQKPEPVKESRLKPCAENFDPQLGATATPVTVDKVAGSSSKDLLMNRRRRLPDANDQSEHAWPQPAIARPQAPWDAPTAASKMQKTCTGSERAGGSWEQAAQARHSAFSAQSVGDQDLAIGRQNCSGSRTGGAVLVGIAQEGKTPGTAGQQGFVGSSLAPDPRLSNRNTTQTGTGDSIQPTLCELALASRHIQQCAAAGNVSWVQTSVRPGGAGQDVARGAGCPPRRDMVDLPGQAVDSENTHSNTSSNTYSNTDLPVLPVGISNTSSNTSRKQCSNTYRNTDLPVHPVHPGAWGEWNGGAPREGLHERQETPRGKELEVAQEPHGARGGGMGGGGRGSGLGNRGAAASGVPGECAASHAEVAGVRLECRSQAALSRSLPKP